MCHSERSEESENINLDVIRFFALLRMTLISNHSNYWCCSRNKSLTVFTGLNVPRGTSTKIVDQSLIAPFHKPGSSRAFNSLPLLDL